MYAGTSAGDSILTRLAEVEAGKRKLESRLSSPGHEQKEMGRSPKQAPHRRHFRTQSWVYSTSICSGSSQPSTSSRNASPQPMNASSPLLDFLVEHERYVTIFDGIYRQLDIRDVLTISRTCKKLGNFYQDMIPSKWNINRRLTRFVDDPKEFRTRLGLAGALISGTFALLFFAQLYWLDSGLDIYVRQGSKADEFIRYIGEDMHYEFDYSYTWSDDDVHRTLTKVLIFHRRGPPGSPQIRFHLTRTLPLHSIMTECAFSTAHVNVISWNKAYCMFPHTTFVSRRMFFLHTPDEALGQILSRYSAQGWRSSDWADYDTVKGCLQPGIRERTRRLGDPSTWVIPINLDRVKAPSTPDSVLENCTFQVYADRGPRELDTALAGLKTFSIGARTFKCCMLKHRYTFHAPDSGWTVFLRNKLNRMSMLEILKTGDPNLQAQIRRADFNLDDCKQCPLLRAMPHFCRPEGWKSADHLIPKWFTEWKESDGKIVEDLKPRPLNISRPIYQQKRKPEPLCLAQIPPRTSSLLGRSLTTPSTSPQRDLQTPLSSSKSDCFPSLQRTREARYPNRRQKSLINRPQRAKSDCSSLPRSVPKAQPSPQPCQSPVSPRALEDNASPRLQKPIKVSTSSLPWPSHALPLQGEVFLPDCVLQIPTPPVPVRHIETRIAATHHHRASATSQLATEDCFSLSHRQPNAPVPPLPCLSLTSI